MSLIEEFLGTRDLYSSKILLLKGEGYFFQKLFKRGLFI